MKKIGKFVLKYENIKELLIQNFSEIDPKKKNFDEELQNYINNAEGFLIKHKRVFFI